MARKPQASPPPEPDSSESELKCYTPEQLAELLGVTENWVKEAVKFRRIPHTRVGRYIRFQQRHIRAITEADDYDPTRRGRKSRLSTAA